MRVLAIATLGAAMMLPAAAHAGHYKTQAHSSYNTACAPASCARPMYRLHGYQTPPKRVGNMQVSRQNGVTVYRAKQPEFDYAAYARIKRTEQRAARRQAMAARFARQQSKIRSQAETIDSLESRIGDLEQQNQRPYYGNARPYYYANPIYVGRGNRGHRGRGFKGQGIRVSYRSGSRH